MSVAPGPGTESAFVALRLQTGDNVRLVELAPAEASALRAAALASHPALAILLEMVELGDGRSVGVFEWVPGSTLGERLARGRGFTPKVALRLAILMADVLAVLHRRGAVHGLLTPDCIVLGNRERGQPVLSYAPRAPGTPYDSPERRQAGPRASDDVWALAAILHELIARRPPPPTGYTELLAVQEAGIGPPELAAAIGGCLLRDPERRIKTVQLAREDFARALQAITGGHPAATEPSDATNGGTPVFAETWRSPQPPGNVPRWLRPLLALVAVAAALVFAVLLVGRWTTVDPGVPQGAVSDGPLSATSSAPTRKSSGVAPPKAKAHAPKPDADAIRVDALPSDREIAGCVMAQFPEGSFETTPDYSWLCLTRDPRRGSARMRSSLVSAAGKNRLTPAMDIWSRLGWYGMAGFAVVRQSCCPEAAPVELEPPGSCERLDAIINDLARAAQQGRATESYIRRYADNVRCQLQSGNGAWFQVGVRFGGGQDTALKRLLESRQRESARPQ